MDIKTFLEKLKYGETEPPPKKDYSEILKIIKKKYRKSVTIKLTKSKKVITAAWDPLFPSTIYFSKEFWRTLTPKERLAVAWHEIGHRVLHFKYQCYFFLVLFIAAISYLSLIDKNPISLVIWVVFVSIFLSYYLNRLEEKSADSFAAKEVGKEVVISALKKIKINKNKNIAYLLNHPSTEKRIKNLEKNS
jgi:Zn-dependent protease with chaperone function